MLDNNQEHLNLKRGIKTQFAAQALSGLAQSNVSLP